MATLGESDKRVLRQITEHIQANLRAGLKSGLAYIDIKDHKTKVLVRQNHVVFGRRGAGKSTLMRSIVEDARNKRVCVVSANLEDFKDVSFPDILIQVLIGFVARMKPAVLGRGLWRRWALRWRMKRLRRHLRHLLSEPEDYDSDERRLVSRQKGAAGNVRGVSGQISASSETEVRRLVKVDKLETLRKMMPLLKSAVEDAAIAQRIQCIFLVLDDFYFIDKGIQPDVLDYFHRLTKDTPLYLKVATIKHRTRLYRTADRKYVGAELNHDIFPVDLDYTLDNFVELQRFMRQLLDGLAHSAGTQWAWLDRFFQGDGFSQLCLASGGVPRDFLALFAALLDRLLDGEIDSIGKVDVTEAAINNTTEKLQAFNDDSAEERDTLHGCLQWIKDFVITKKRQNTFLVAKEDLEKNPQERQAIKELMDLRFIHLVDSNTSAAPSDGRRYEAYMVDVGMYPNSRPRNFTQIDPAEKDEKSRQDRLRASPRLSLRVMNREVEQLEDLILTPG